jgi:hypothetical protein
MIRIVKQVPLVKFWRSWAICRRLTRHRPDPDTCLPNTGTHRPRWSVHLPSSGPSTPLPSPGTETRRRDSSPPHLNEQHGSLFKKFSTPLKAPGKAISREDTPPFMGPRLKKFYKQNVAKCEASGEISGLFLATLTPPTPGLPRIVASWRSEEP